MKKINIGSNIKIYWKIWRGANKVTEDFNSMNTNLKVFLVGLGDTYYLEPSINNTIDPGYDVIELSIPAFRLDVGVFNIKAIWEKNGGRNVLTSMRASVLYLTDSPSEAPIQDEEVRIVSLVESFGRDGMSAYESAVMRGVNEGVTSEIEWVKSVSVFNEKERLANEGVRVANEAERVANEEQRRVAEKRREWFKEGLLEQVNSYKPIEITGDVTNAADEEDITSDENNLLKLKDRTSINGMGYKILRMGKPLQEQMNLPNTIYEIRYNFNLNGDTLTIPEHCILKYNGGCLEHCKIIGSETKIKAQRCSIFNNVELVGTWDISTSYPEWFSGKLTSNINRCLEYMPNSLVSISGEYIYDEKILLNNARCIQNEGRCVINAENVDGIVMEIYNMSNVINLSDTTIIVGKDRTSDIVVLRGGREYDRDESHLTDGIKKANYDLPFVVCNSNGGDKSVAQCSAFVIDLSDRFHYIIEQQLLLRARYIRDCVYIKKPTGEDSFMSNDNFIIYSWWCVNGLRFETSSFAGGGLYFYLFYQPSELSLKIIQNDTPESRSSMNKMNWRFDIVPWDIHFMETGAAKTHEVIDWTLGWNMRNLLTSETRLSKYFTNKHLWNNECDSLKFEDVNHSMQTIDDQFLLYYHILRNVTEDDDRLTAIKKMVNNIIHIGYDSTVEIFIPPLNAKYTAYSYIDKFKILFGDDSVKYDGYSIIKIIKERISNGLFESVIFECYGSVSYYESFDIKIEDNIVLNTFEIAEDPSGNKITKDIVGKGCSSVIQTCSIKDPNIPARISPDILNRYEKDDNIGYPIYLERANIPQWWTGNKWIYADGLPAKSRRGQTSARPELTSSDFGFMYYDTNLKKPIVWNGNKWVNTDGTYSGSISGGTPYRPTDLKLEDAGVRYFDTDKNKVFWWDGRKWVDSSGISENDESVGLFENKPSSPKVGFAYFCTDRYTEEGGQNGIVIYHKGNNVWCDALGRVIS